MSCLVFSTLNSARLKIVADSWKKENKVSNPLLTSVQAFLQVLGPEEANLLEPVFLPTSLNLRLGASLTEVVVVVRCLKF